MDDLEINKKKNRDDFDQVVINTAKLQAAYICSRPECRRSTLAPSLTDENKIQYSGKVAHITAAAPGGPRYDANISEIDRKSINNAVFLCSNCADLIDKNNGIDYPTPLLYKWKEDHREWVTTNLNKGPNDQSSTNITSFGQSGGITAQIINIHPAIDEQVDPSKVHDIETFKRSEQILNNTQWISLKEDLIGNASCKIRESNRLNKIHDFFSKVENGFIDDEIDAAREAFISNIPPLTDMLGLKFDQWPYNQNVDNFNIQLMPNYLRDTMYTKATFEQRKEWDVLYAEMVGYIETVASVYNVFRKLVKRKLHI